MKAIVFCHWTEIFTLINLFGTHHVSWWWMALFFAHDGISDLWASHRLDKDRDVLKD